ncbi:MAG: methyl-accepting chemotaxis protein [Methylococcales bacterium]
MNNTKLKYKILGFGVLLAVGISLIGLSHYWDYFIQTLIATTTLFFLGLIYLARSILRPIERIKTVVRAIDDGDYGERIKLQNVDEFSELGHAFNRLLDEKVNDVTEAEKETEQLNHSIIGLLQAVDKLSQKDLTVDIPVAKDITGAISDALNQLTYETCEVLKRAAEISHRVNRATIKVKSQSQEVLEYTETQNRQTNQSIVELTGTIDAMNEIAMLANQANRESEKAVDMTESALTAVNKTVENAKNLRNIMRETEKRIKCLRERSQEITSAVNIINEIAEKTHILALNASMHAASAGDAGKGFMVVADEVQRLAESSREATSQVAAFVYNIQTETSDTVEIMSTAIDEAIEGTHLAGQAGIRMQENRETTLALVDSVHTINQKSKSQAKASESLRQRTHGLQESAEAVYSQLCKQTAYTDTLVEDAKDLVSTVQVFKLPA